MRSAGGGSPASRQDATSYLLQLVEGDRQAGDRLFEMVYAQLHAQASALLRRERSDHTLQSTALVHEAWLRLIDGKQVDLEDKGHFMSLAARAMRRILVDHARGRNRQKRGGSWQRIELDGAPQHEDTDALDLVALDQALEILRSNSDHLATIVEMRFFAGLTREEIAESLGVSRSKVMRDWRLAKALLTQFLEGMDVEEA